MFNIDFTPSIETATAAATLLAASNIGLLLYGLRVLYVEHRANMEHSKWMERNRVSRDATTSRVHGWKSSPQMMDNIVEDMSNHVANNH